MKLGPMRAGEHRYAVAIRDGSDRWLTLWVRRNPRGEFFVLLPRDDGTWDPHASYHLDGAFHTKTQGRKMQMRTLQRLDGTFHGVEHLGQYWGHGRSIGVICDAACFSGVVEIPPDVLTTTRGGVAVELGEPGHTLPVAPWFEIVTIFRDALPWVVITIGRLAEHAA